MDNLSHNVKEKLQKTYSFSGTQLLVTGLWVIILLSILACAGRGHGWPRGMMMNHNMKWGRQEMIQTRDNKRAYQQDMRRWQDSQSVNNQEQPEPMMNNNQNNQPTAPSVPSGIGN